MNALGTRLVGRRGGRSYRLGDPIEVRVEKVERAEGKVELSLATGGAPFTPSVRRGDEAPPRPQLPQTRLVPPSTCRQAVASALIRADA